LNIAICDDEKIIQEQIYEWIIKEIKENQHIFIEFYKTGETLLATKNQFDIIFLDILMDGKNGIETAKELRQKDENVILIFITGIREYVFEAFDVAAFHYLLKPIEESKFREIFYKAIRELEKRKKQQPIFIKTRNRSFSLERNNILYIESKGKRVEIHTTEKTIDAYISMNEMEGQLGDEFYRCHRGYLVNMAYIAEYNSESIILNNGECVYLSKEKYGKFVKAYMRYLRKGVYIDD